MSRNAPRALDWRDSHDPTQCGDCVIGNPHPIDIDTDGNGVWSDGKEAWNSGEPLTEDELLEVEG